MLRMGFKFPAAWFGPSNDVFKEKSNPGFTETIANDFAPLEFYCLILCSQFKAKGYTFDECLKMASVADIDDVSIPFLHINQLTENKKAVNSTRNQVDVLAREHIRELRDDTKNYKTLLWPALQLFP